MRRSIPIFLFLALIVQSFTSFSTQLVFAKEIKAAKKEARPQQDKKLTPENIEKEAYRIWLAWYRAHNQGKKLPTPVFNVPASLGNKEADRVLSIWEQAQNKAYWVVQKEWMYKVWLQWYQAQAQGKQDPKPSLNIPSSVDVKEANQALTLWYKAEASAKLTVERQAHNIPKQSNDDLESLEAEINPTASTALPGAIVNPNPSPFPGINQQKGIAGLIAKTFNSTQPNQNNQQRPSSLQATQANTNRLLAELSAEAEKAKAAKKAEAIKQISQQQADRLRQNLGPETSSGFQVTRRYTYGLGPGPISMSQLINGQWVTSFFIYDGEGDVRALTDEHGNVTDTFDYDGFGNLINRTGNTPNTRLYKGEEYDPDLGLYYLRNRWYNLATGRFMTGDPLTGNLSEPISQHRYLYANANPVNRIDPNGLSSIAFFSAINISSVLSTIGALNTNAGKYITASAVKVIDNPVVLSDTGWSVGDAMSVLQTASTFWKRYNINVQFSAVTEFRCNVPSLDCGRLYSGDIGTLASRSGQNPDVVNVAADSDWEKHIAPLIPNFSNHNTVFVGALYDPKVVPLVARTNVFQAGKFTGKAISLLSSPSGLRSQPGAAQFAGIETLGFILAHEWGHTFNLPETSLPVNIMNPRAFVPAQSLFNLGLIDEQAEIARKFAFGKY
jgi:RHS repeat-associated protein